MAIPVFQVDAFTERPFSGNPACVCLMDDQRKSDDWLQSVAAEMNLSETAFVWSAGDRFHLRWFTPVAEVKLCGHATLASAHILWSSGRVARDDPVVFDTLSGKLSATRHDDQIMLDFPANRPAHCGVPGGLLEGLGINNFEYIGSDGTDFLVEPISEADVGSLRPDFRHLAGLKIRGIIVTAPSEESEYDFVSRFFAPAFGVDEDPVTGSAHTVLAPFWSGKLGKMELRARQLSGRGGVVTARVDGDRVLLGGNAVTVFTGELVV